MTLGTLTMSALVLAGCGGGTGSFFPRAADRTATTPAAAGRQVKSLREGLSAGDVRPLCGAVTRGRARCTSYVLTPSGMAASPALAAAAATAARPAPPPGYGPAELQSAYRLTAAAKSKGSDAVIAIVDAFDDPRAEHDLAAYRAMYNLPACTTANGCFRKVNQDGKTRPLPPPPPADSTGWQVETSLDLDMVSANCPRCSILLVESNDDFMNNLGSAVNAAAKLGANAISNSYVAQESPTDPLLPAQDGLLWYYVHPHVAVVAGSGDFNFMTSGPAYGALIPAAFPSVVAVGGTSLAPDSFAARGWDEWAWDGGGSGCSAYEPMPPWQTANGSCTGSFTDPSGRTITFPSRIYTDVAYDASTYTGMAVYDSNGQFGANGWGVVGGTSAASPAIAAIYGLAGYGNGDDRSEEPFPARKLYASRRSLFDVASGSNGTCAATFLCTAGAGYDGPTGNGTPNGTDAFSR